MVLALTLVLILALAPSGMISKKGVPTFFPSTVLLLLLLLLLLLVLTEQKIDYNPSFDFITGLCHYSGWIRLFFFTVL